MNGLSPKITVIIPVYNVEKYIRRCVDSVLGQTYNNLEVILVDDGSPDGCPAICDEYAHRDCRVTALHKKNGGLSSARNAALDYPLTGDFVTFVDSDDWIANNTYEYCINALNKFQADTIQYNIKLVSDKSDNICQPAELVDCYRGKEILQYYMYSTTIKDGYSVCRCLFPKCAVENVRFREGKINEDIDFKYKVLSKCNQLVVSNQYLYFYYQSGNTTSSGGLKRKDFDLYDAANELMLLAENETFGTIKKLAKVKQARTALSLLCKIAYWGVADVSINKEETISKLIKENRSNLWCLLNSPLRKSRKVLAVLFAVNYNLAEIVIKIGKRI